MPHTKSISQYGTRALDGLPQPVLERAISTAITNKAWDAIQRALHDQSVRMTGGFVE